MAKKKTEPPQVKQQETTEDIFVDAEEYQGAGEGLTFRMIVLNHLSRILVLSSKEMRGGFWETKPVVVGGGIVMTKKYIEDSREAYTSAVNSFYDILSSYFDDEMKKIGNELDEEFKQLKEKYKIKINGDNKAANFENYKTEKLNIKRRMFRALCNFLHRKKYLELAYYE